MSVKGGSHKWTGIKKMNEIKYISFRISPELHKSAKMESCNQEISLQEWVTRLIEKALGEKFDHPRYESGR